MFEERDLAEIRSESYPGERLVVCRNGLLAENRARKREELLPATEKDLAKLQAATMREARRLHGREEIGLRVGKVLGRHKVGKHFKLVIGNDSFTFSRRTDKIAAEAALDGFYVLRTSLKKSVMDEQDVVRAYQWGGSPESAGCR